MNRKFATLLGAISMILFCMPLNSCSDDDEPDDSYYMKWSLNGKSVDNQAGIFASYDDVNPSGESYAFVCTNTEFDKVVITDCEADYETVSVSQTNPETISGDWYTITVSGMNLTVTFAANDSGDERYLDIATNSSSLSSLGFSFSFTQDPE